MNTSDFITTDYLVSQIVVLTNDEDLRSGINKGWYIDKIQQALAEISFDSKFNQETCDKINWFEAGDPYITLPSGCFSVKDVYMFNGTVDAIESQVRVHYKRGFNNVNKTSGYTAKIKETGSPLTHESGQEIYPSQMISSGLVYGALYDGILMLSDSATSWDNCRIIYYGVPFDIGEIPAIPVYLKEYVIDYVTEYFFRAAKVKNRDLIIHWRDSYTNLYGDGRRNVGSLMRAQRRCKEISKFESDSLREYWSRAQHIYS